MKIPLHDPARPPSGQFVDRTRRSGAERTVVSDRPMPSDHGEWREVDGGPLPISVAGTHGYRIKSRVGAKTTRLGGSTVYSGPIKGGKKRVIGGGKAVRLRKYRWLFHWRAANDVAPQRASDPADAAHLTAAERVVLQQALLRLAALPPGFTDDLFNAPPFPAGYPEILGGD